MIAPETQAVVHVAAKPAGDIQPCTKCGLLLVDMTDRKWTAVEKGWTPWWPPGMDVAHSFGGWYALNGRPVRQPEEDRCIAR